MITFHSANSGGVAPKITVIGVGGAGSNAVNNMIQSQLEGVEFVVANTDSQSLMMSRTDRRIQLGLQVTQGLGAGARPETGRIAAEETLEEIMNELLGSNMLFITAGMGGGTGTGAAPVIARAARESGILTVGVVTKPFDFEGRHRQRLAQSGIEELGQHVDTLIVIPNQKLFGVASEKTTFADAFKMADNVLYSGVRGVTDLMIMPGLINLDFADVRTVMSEMGKAMMGTGEGEGERRALDAAEAAINNRLLDDTSMKGARAVLVNITGSEDITLLEVDEAMNRIYDEVDPEANIIFGSTYDNSMNGRIRVSVVATGIAVEGMEMTRPVQAPVIQTAKPPEAKKPAQAVAAEQAPNFVPPAPKPQPIAEAEAELRPAEQKRESAATAQAQPIPQASTTIRRPVPRQDAPEQGNLSIEEPEIRYGERAVGGARAPQPDHGQKPGFLGGIFTTLTGNHPRPQEASVQVQQRPTAQRPRVAQPEAARQGQPAPSQTRINPNDRLATSPGEDEMLDIPAFLRRQAN